MKHPIVGLAAIAIVGTACSGPGRNDRAFEWTNEIPAGSVVHFRNGVGDISVRRAVGQSVVVTADTRWRRSRANDIQFRVDHSGNDYYVCAMWRGSGSCGARGYRGRHVGGVLSVFSLFHRGSDATANFVAELPSNVTVDARTDQGSVQIDGLEAGVTARTSLGTVSALNVSGPLSLSSANGNVRLATDSLSPADSIHLWTTNGTVRAQLPASLEGAFDLSVVNGTVKSDFPLPAAPRARAERHLLGQIGPSTRMVKMRAVNGSVSVSTRGAHEH